MEESVSESKRAIQLDPMDTILTACVCWHRYSAREYHVSIEKRIVLPAGPADRGNEAISVSVGDHNQVAMSGVQNAPGTHAAVFSDAFLVVQGSNLF